jgi:hypothetical protein
MEPKPPDPGPGPDWAEIFSVAVSVVLLGFVLYQLAPVRDQTQRWGSQLRRWWQARAAAESAARHLAFEVSVVLAALGGDPDGLAERLEVA